MTLTNPSLILEFVASSVIPTTTVTSTDIVRQSIEIDFQMMSDLKSSSDKAKVTIKKNSAAVSRILSFDGDIKAVLKDGETILFTGFLSNKYKWTVTNHGEQALSLTIEDNTRLLETIYSERDQLVNKEFYVPAKIGHPVASGFLLDICNACGISLSSTVPEVDTQIIRNIPADTSCVDIMDRVCFELGYCYKFDNTGKLYLWKIAKGDEVVSAVLDKTNLYAVDENGIIVNKALRQYNRAIVKYTEISERTGTLVYQDISGQDDNHPYCYIEVPPGTAYPSGLTIAGRSDDELRAVCEATDLDKGKAIIGIGDSIVTDFSCTDSSITCDIHKYSAKALSVLIKNTSAVPVFILKLRAKADITYEEGDSKIYAGSISDKKYYETELDYVHDNTAASSLGNLICQFYKHSNLSYQFYSKEKLEIGQVIKLVEDVHTGIEAKLMINARVDLSSSDIYHYTAFSFTPFNLAEPTTTSSSIGAPAVIPPAKVIIQYAVDSSPDTPPGTTLVLGPGVDSVFGSGEDSSFGTISDKWQSSVPYPVAEGMYVWMRTSSDGEKTWAYSRVTGEKGERGKDGDENIFILHVARSTFVQNRRSNDIQRIAAYCEIVGYPETSYATITAVNATYSGGYLLIPYNNTFNVVTVTAVLKDGGETLATQTVNLDPIDETALPEFLGCLSALPTTTTSGAKIIDGDYFCVKSNFTADGNSYTKGECWRRNQGGWLKLNTDNGTADEMLTCLHAFKEAGVDFDSISDSSSIAWFNSIVTHSIIAETIKAKKGFFDDIEIGGSAVFKGTIVSDPLSTNGGTTTTKTYISDSSSVSGGSFKWEDVASFIASNYSHLSGTVYDGDGTLNGKTISKFLYYQSTPSHTEIIDSGTLPATLNPKVTVYTATYNSRLRITVSKDSGFPDAVRYEIYKGSTLESSTVIISGMTGGTETVTTSVIPAGCTVKIAANIGTETYSVKLHHVDNFDSGTNVITSDGTVYNLGKTGSVTSVNYLTGVGTNLLITAMTSLTYHTLVQCNSSGWTSGVAKYNNWAGKTGGDASSSGAGKVTSYSIQVRRSGGSTVTYYADYAVWDANSLQLSYGGNNVLTLNTSSSNLEYWYINLTIEVSTGGLVTQTILPKSHFTYDLGSTDHKWRNGYFSSISASSISTDSFSADNLYGQIGSDGSRKDAYIDTLYANTISGLSIFDPSTKMKTYPAGNNVTSTGQIIHTLGLALGQMAIEGITVASNIGNFYITPSGSGTYGIFVVMTSNYCNSTGGSVTAASTSLAAGSNLAVPLEASSGGAGGFMFYWRVS